VRGALVLAPLPPTLRSAWAAGYNPWTSLVQAWPMSFRTPGAVVLGPRLPVNAEQALAAHNQMQLLGPPASSSSTWDTSALLTTLQQSDTATPPSSNEWFLDTGASTHMSHTPGNFAAPVLSNFPSYITVGNGPRLPVSHSAAASIPINSSPFTLIMS
jgi:hypothetical protein